MEDKVRMVGVRRWFVHTRVDPTWASPKPPSPLSIPPRPYLPDFPASGTTRVPAPLWKRCAIRRVRKCSRCGISAIASTCLLSSLVTRDDLFSKKLYELLYTSLNLPVKRRTCNLHASSAFPRPLSLIPIVAYLYPPPHRRQAPGVLRHVAYLKSYSAFHIDESRCVPRQGRPSALGHPCRCGQPPV
jgi:hypothetical protein